MNDAARQMARELADWQPRAGVISVYLDIDPADRGEGWRIELEHSLKRIADDRSAPANGDALAAATDRIRARLPRDAPHRSGRAQVGFVEVDGEGRELWNGYQAGLERSQITYGPHAVLAPLIRLLQRGAPLGVILLAAEEARGFEWAHGRLADLGDWQLEVKSLDWRERRSPQRDPQTGGTGTTASGRDQHRQRLDASRARYLKQLGNLLAGRFGERDWRRILVFGENDVPALLSAGLGPQQAGLVHEVRRDLIRAERAELEEHVEAEVAAINLAAERDLLDRLEEAMGTDTGVAVGPEEVLGALEQGRVRHLIINPADDLGVHDGRPRAEAMIGLALVTSAAITPIEDEDLASRLAQREGAAALLRY